jgi:hypothetical protein
MVESVLSVADRSQLGGRVDDEGGYTEELISTSASMSMLSNGARRRLEPRVSAMLESHERPGLKGNQNDPAFRHRCI